MDTLRLIVKSMKTIERKDFRQFIQNQRKLSKRIDLKLFDLLTNHSADKDMENSLYGKPNKAAYHAVRKRLTRKLTDFIVLKRIEEDTTSSSSLMGMISLAKYFFERRSDELAWLYLNKAESKALKAEQFDLLNLIYQLQIEHWHQDFAPDIHSIIDKRTANKKLLDEDERATIASSLIKKELQKTVRLGREVDFEGTTQLILSSYDLNNALVHRPKILFNILSIGRSVILAKKDFYSFEPYLIQQYEKARSQFGFGRTAHYYKLNLLYMISHVLYRNRKFAQATAYLHEMENDLFAYSSSHTVLFFAKYTLLSAAVHSYEGKLDKAIEILTEAIAQHPSMFSAEDKVKLQLNLSIYYFMAEDYQMSIKTGMFLDHTDKWLEKKLGREWVFKKQIMEVIIQAELRNDDIVLNRIRALERASKAMFDHPLYARAKAFLELIKLLVTDPFKFEKQETRLRIEKQLITVPEEQEDLQAMTFYAWLKSKYVNRRFYEVLLETVKLN
jgi:hypothetical protein